MPKKKRFYFQVSRTVEQMSTVEVVCYTEEEAKCLCQEQIDRGITDWEDYADDDDVAVVDMSFEEIIK